LAAGGGAVGHEAFVEDGWKKDNSQYCSCPFERL
jgi:hypothetical protein